MGALFFFQKTERERGETTLIKTLIIK